MSTIETQASESEFDPSENNPFVSINEASSAAQRMVDLPQNTGISSSLEYPESVPTIDPKSKVELTTGQKITRGVIKGTVGVVLATGAGAAVGAAAGAITNPSPETYSDETIKITANNNDDLYKIAESIPGINTTDLRATLDHIAGDPANIDVLKDGLQAGEQLTVPVSINGVESEAPKE